MLLASCGRRVPLGRSLLDWRTCGPAVGRVSSVVRCCLLSTGPSPRPLHENIYTLPNALTVSRILATPVLGAFILQDQWTPACALLVYAGTTDLVDGWLARRYKMNSVLGTILDPAADKFLMTTLTVTLAIKGLLPGPLALIILGRDVALSLTAFYIRYISLAPPKTLSRYFDFSIPSAEVHPTAISKFNTFAQLLLLGLTTSCPVLGPELLAWVTGHWIGMGFLGKVSVLGTAQWIVGTTTVWSGLSYIYAKDTIKYIK